MALKKSTDPLVNEPTTETTDPTLVEGTTTETTTPTLVEDAVPQEGELISGGYPSRDFFTPLGYPQPTYEGPNV